MASLLPTCFAWKGVGLSVLQNLLGNDNDLHGSFCIKRIDRNWLGKELGDEEKEADAGADCDAAAAD